MIRLGLCMFMVFVFGMLVVMVVVMVLCFRWKVCLCCSVFLVLFCVMWVVMCMFR